MSQAVDLVVDTAKTVVGTVGDVLGFGGSKKQPQAVPQQQTYYPPSTPMMEIPEIVFPEIPAYPEYPAFPEVQEAPLADNQAILAAKKRERAQQRSGRTSGNAGYSG